MKFYPKLEDMAQSKDGWEDALPDADIFGDDHLEGFMGLEVFHGEYIVVCVMR